MAAEPGPGTCLVDLEPVGRRVQVKAGTTLLAAAQEAGVELVSLCGGAGSCGACRVRLVAGRLSPLTLVEQAELSPADIAAGIRLACQAVPLNDVTLDIPPESLTAPQRLQVESQAMTVALDPPVVPVDVRLPPPDLYDLRADDARLVDELARQGYPGARVGFAALTDLAERLRSQDWSARLAVRQGEVMAVLPYPGPGVRSGLYGLAVDVGTTKVAGYLVDLVSGETAARGGVMNPQIAYGEDVVSRIAYTNTQPDGRGVLQRRLVETLNGLVAELCAEVGVGREQIVEAVIVGNTVMHHLLAGLPVRQLGASPYVPAAGAAIEFPARAVGLELAYGARIYMPPNIAGYVGADHVAMLVGAGLVQIAQNQPGRTVLALDIGTNTEISLFHQGRWLSCSCASGPAFEGAHIRDGMRAAPGAIERVRIAAGEVQTQTIGGLPAVGICGSGILDAVAGLLANGVLDHRGVLRGEHPRLQRLDGKAAFVLAPAESSGHGREVVITRQDVNEIQLAKGAIRTGVEILLREAGILAEKIEEFIVAGAFGTYLDLASAIGVGMFPDLPVERYRQVGNAAGAGAVALLLSNQQRRLAAEITPRIEYVELTVHPGFTNEYMRSLMFARSGG